MCGSSFINERYREFLMQRLETQRENIENRKENITLESLVESESIMSKFEMHLKRRVNLSQPEKCYRWFKVSGLRPDVRFNFVWGSFQVCQ